MSQAWIKIEIITLDKIEVARIATALGMDHYAVMGRLIRLWGYFDQHSLDGHIEGIDASIIDHLVGHPGFCAQLANVGWMTVEGAGVTLPNFHRHNGDTAKSRALTARRTEKYREKKARKYKRHQSDARRDAPPSHAASPEKRKEEEKRKDQKAPEGAGQGVSLFSPQEEPNQDGEINRLAQKATFLRGRGTDQNEIARWHSHLADLIRDGQSIAAIEAELDRPDRRTSEAAWDFEKRLSGDEHAKRPDTSDPYAGFRSAIEGAS